jgi:hypothetical protein
LDGLLVARDTERLVGVEEHAQDAVLEALIARPGGIVDRMIGFPPGQRCPLFLLESFGLGKEVSGGRGRRGGLCGLGGVVSPQRAAGRAERSGGARVAFVDGIYNVSGPLHVLQRPQGP